MTTEIPTTDRGDEPLELDANVDPVCEMTVEPEEAAVSDMALEYEGRTYLFCCAGCRYRFAQEPARYAAVGRSQP